MSREWTEQAARYLSAASVCPRCDSAEFQDGRCATCGLILDVSALGTVFVASERAVAALRERQLTIDRAIAASHQPAAPSEDIPPFPGTSAAAALAAAGISAASGAIPAAPVSVPPAVAADTRAAERPSSQISVQSVLALTGAGLFAIAAIVFTFFNPELTDFRTRTAIVGGITVLFIGGAWFLARKRLQLSAESVGALGMVFLGLDVWAVTQLVQDGPPAWIAGAIATLVASVLTTVIAVLVRLRTWLWLAPFGFALVPVFVGTSFENVFSVGVGFVAAGYVLLAWALVLRRLSPRFASGLRTDAATGMALRFTALGLGLLFISFAEYDRGPLRSLSVAVAFAGSALLAALLSRIELARTWSLLGGAFATAAAAILPLALLLDVQLYLALIPACAAAAVLLLALPRANGTASAAYSRVGAWSVLLLLAVPAALTQLARLSARLLAPSDVFPDGTGLSWDVAGALGLAAVAAVTLALALVGRLPRGAELVAWWLTPFVLVGLAGAQRLPFLTVLIVTLVAAGVLAGLRVAIPVIRRLPTRFASPYLATIHLLLVLAATASWSDTETRVWGNIAVVIVAALLTAAMPRMVRPVYAGVAYAYALIIFARFLDDAGLESLAVLCLTTSAAAVTALVISLLDRVPARYWYAILVVTSAPFLIGVTSVIVERSGWTALSTGLICALAITLVATRRPGLTWVLRGLATVIVVPSIAVVVICLGAQVLAVSASPVTLPIIAAVVGLAFPLGPLVGRLLAVRGVDPHQARAIRAGFEASVLLTGALAALLALLRTAAGLETAILVLGIIGVGAALAAFLQHARRFWIIAAASFTLALWSAWALLGIQTIEPYVLPPAIASLVLGIVLIALGRRAGWFYVGGLGASILATVVSLCVDETVLASPNLWRTAILWTVAVLLLLAAALAGRAFGGRLASLRTPTLLGAVLAAAAAPVLTTRLAVVESVLRQPDGVVLSVLGACLLSAVLAAAGGYLLARLVSVPGESSPRWVYAPAVVYLVTGPIANVNENPLSYWSLWVLATALSAVMVASSWRGRVTVTTLPPVWLLFTVAWFTAVAGWSERELRVEFYSLPLGLALVLAGILGAARHTDPVRRRSMNLWPNGFHGSWATAAPGLVATLLPSMLATMTDPLTWRAVLVISMALTAILIGSLLKRAAPFFLGLATLPIEIVFVFLAQIGRNIEAATWWITLATAGAVLLVIAVTFERRSSGGKGVAARLRDMR